MEDKKMKVLKGQIPVSILYIALGVCLALMPVETVNVLCKVVFGLVLVGAGLYHIVIYVLEKENATILDLFSGVIVLVIGAFLFMNPQVVVKLLTLMLGALHSGGQYLDASWKHEIKEKKAWGMESVSH